MNRQKILESVIHRLLAEAEDGGDHLQRRMKRVAQLGMAAHVFQEKMDGENSYVAILYDSDELMMYLDEIRSGDLDVILDNIMLGVIAIIEPEDPCNGAWQIAQSAVKHAGDGGIIYDIAFALSPTGTLIPDRYSVSPSAKAGWKKQGGRKTKTLDAVSGHKSRIDPTSFRAHPNHTDDTSDDCETYEMPGEEFLDMSYEARGHERALLKHLQDEHERAMDELSVGVDSWVATSRKKRVIAALEQLSNPFFNRYYKGGTI